MKRIAIISDIHGNMPALEAVLKDIAERQITSIYCLGDLIGKGPSSDLAVDTVRTHCEQVVSGNWDDFISKESELDVVHWHQAILGEERLQYLNQLPFSIEFVMSGKFIRLFHASPRSLYERVQPWDDQEQRESLFESSDRCVQEKIADVVAYGDIHNAYMQHLNGKTLINVGSVGNPLDMTQASYVIMEGEMHSTAIAPFNIQFIRVPYDIELAIRQAMETDMPHLGEYKRELRTGVYRGLS
ncbi:metallophosphoesterase family protein [Paenibacillus sp. FA6]|uniref:metallophosphoesterase family protein n=1 Tax=Paenibacillus sp. FA6 TaxID=3413029 RepID=UPI003F65C351